MAYSYGKSVTVGESTKKSEMDQAYVNEDYLYDRIKAFEEELAFDAGQASYYAEYSYDVNGDLIALNIYIDNTKTAKLWDIDYTYTSGLLTQMVIVRVSDLTTLTYDYSYSGDDLVSITKTIT